MPAGQFRPIDTLSRRLRGGDCDHIIQGNDQRDRQVIISCAKVIHDLPLGDGDVTTGQWGRGLDESKKDEGAGGEDHCSYGHRLPLLDRLSACLEGLLQRRVVGRHPVGDKFKINI